MSIVRKPSMLTLPLSSTVPAVPAFCVSAHSRTPLTTTDVCPALQLPWTVVVGGVGRFGVRYSTVSQPVVTVSETEKTNPDPIVPVTADAPAPSEEASA